MKYFIMFHCCRLKKEVEKNVSHSEQLHLAIFYMVYLKPMKMNGACSVQKRYNKHGALSWYQHPICSHLQWAACEHRAQSPADAILNQYWDFPISSTQQGDTINLIILNTLPQTFAFLIQLVKDKLKYPAENTQGVQTPGISLDQQAVLNTYSFLSPLASMDLELWNDELNGTESYTAGWIRGNIAIWGMQNFRVTCCPTAIF